MRAAFLVYTLFSMISLALALTACLGWGVADFLGGLKSRALSAITVLLVSCLAGLGITLLVLLAMGSWPAYRHQLLYAVAGGGLAVVGMLLFYRALAIGQMAIVAPISATGVMLPVLAGLLMGEIPARFQSLGMAAAVLGAVLASWEKGPARDIRVAAGARLAVLAALTFGTFCIVMDQASEVDPYWATFLMRVSQCVFLIPVVAAVRPALKEARFHLPSILAIGLFDTLATFCFTVATTRGLLGPVSVVAFLYPAVTVLLARLVLREKPARIQLCGVALALGGVALISSG